MLKLVRLPRRRPQPPVAVDQPRPSHLSTPNTTHLLGTLPRITAYCRLGRRTRLGQVVTAAAIVTALSGLLLAFGQDPVASPQPIAVTYALHSVSSGGFTGEGWLVGMDHELVAAEGATDEWLSTGDLVWGSPLSKRANIQLGVTTASNLRLRQAPSTASRVLAKLPNGMRLEVLSERAGWYRVATNKAVVGWVSGRYFDLESQARQTKPARSVAPAVKPAPPVIIEKGWRWPTAGRFTSGFGWRRLMGFHNGIDIAARRGTSIRAARSGRVIEAGWCSGYGYCVRLDHGDGFQSEYGHMAWKPPVRKGMQVKVGQVIGYVGSTYDRSGGGYSTGNHLHFTIKYNGTAVNPLRYLP